MSLFAPNRNGSVGFHIEIVPRFAEEIAAEKK